MSKAKIISNSEYPVQAQGLRSCHFLQPSVAFCTYHGRPCRVPEYLCLPCWSAGQEPFLLLVAFITQMLNT